MSIGEEQFGFMEGKSTTDAIFALRRLQERYREGQQDLHYVFIDLEKHTTESRELELYWCMYHWDMYHQCETVVRCVAGTSKPYAVEVGLQQASVLKELPWQLVMLCAMEKDVLEQWWEALAKRGMKVSTAKTEYMCLNGRPC